MNTKLLAVLLIGAAAATAAGTGAYLAVRQNSATTASVEPPVATLPTADRAVAETEGVLTLAPEGTSDVATPAAPAPKPAAVEAPRDTRPAPRARVTESRRPAPPQSPTRVTEPERETRVARHDPAPAVVTPPVESLPIEPVYEPMPAPPPPPAPRFEEITVPADAVIGLQIENNVSSETARIEDRVDARVTRDVRAAGQVAVPAGSRVQGSVTLVEKGGKVKERARLGVRFHTVVLADGTRVPIQTETIFREGDSPSGESAAKIGGAAVGGAIIGAILGGGKGAAIGGSVGAASGTAAVMAGSREPATLTSGSTVTVRLAAPATVTVER